MYVVASGRRSSNRNFAAADAPKYDLVVRRSSTIPMSFTSRPIVLKKSLCVLQDHYDDERDKIVFHKTTPELQDQDQDKDRSV